LCDIIIFNINSFRFGEFNSLVNDEKSKFNEVLRSLESIKREFYQNIETERTRLNTAINESRETALIVTNDRIEKTKEDILIRIRDVEKVNISYFLNIYMKNYYIIS
jgi:hypothetical protein